MFHNAPDGPSSDGSPTGPARKFPVRLIAQHGATMRRVSRRHAIKRFLLRMDVLWPAVFFLFLCCVAVLLVSISRTEMLKSAMGSWREIHHARRALFDKLLDVELDKAHRIAITLMAANAQQPLAMRSEKTLSIVCSTFVTYDTEARLRAVLVASASSKETVTCIHGATNVGSRTTLTGYVSNHSIVKGTYFVDSDTYEFARPLVMATGWPEQAWNISLSMSASLLSTATFRQPMLYYQGVIDQVDPRQLWFYFTRMPHMFYYNVPLSLVARGFNVAKSADLNDFAQVRIDGSALLPLTKYVSARGARAVIFVNQSLHTRDPLIFCTNYGQTAVSNSSVYSASADDPVTYLKSSEVIDPLMLAALKHVNLKALQKEGYSYTTDFSYKGTLAIVTAYTLVTKRGLILPIVTVNAQNTVTPPYLRISNVWAGIIAAVVVILTTLFWWFVHVSFSQPLERITRLMLGNLITGHRTQFYDAGQRVCTQLSEVKELIDAHDDAVRRLRVIDKFIPPELRDRLRGLTRRKKKVSNGSSHNNHTNTVHKTCTALPGDSTSFDSTIDSNQLLQQTLTVVYITIRPPTAATGGDTTLPIRATNGSIALSLESGVRYRRGERLAVVVDTTAAQIGSMVNSGPFPSSASLEQFLSKVEDLCEACSGTVHHLAPDSCVVHFGAAARAHLLRTAAKPSIGGTQRDLAQHHTATTVAETLRSTIALEECSAIDAQNAAEFAVALHLWCMCNCSSSLSPDVRMLLDTSTFTCGHYKPLDNEHTISVAFGRDVQRDLGHIPAKIGVRIAMTEETASLVRGGCGRNGGGGGGDGAAATRAKRQIPVESLHIGRPGLNADIIILYELLPGPADTDKVWWRYRWCCFKAFSCMMDGDYAAAIRTFKEVADISDLEPGLMPASLRREAARSDVTGGAVSTQVERLMRECVRRLVVNDTRRFCRERCDPLGIDTVLRGVSALSDATTPSHRPSVVSSADDAPRSETHTRVRAAVGPVYPRAAERCVVELQTRAGTVRNVVASPPERLQDNVKLHWQVAAAHRTCVSPKVWEFYCTGLGSAGALASLDFLAFRDVPPPVANAIRAAPVGPMSDELRSAVPVCDATPKQKRALRALHKRHRALQHPNLLTPHSYACAMEGGAALVWEYFTGGTLRQVLCRYATIKPATLARFMCGVLGALTFLHERHVAHGAVHMDNVMVNTDGACRLRANCAQQRGTQQLFAVPQTGYVSPAMAAGHAPTPACDMFCYGLLCIELLTRKSPWKWAPVEEGQAQQHTEEDLTALMTEAGQPFFDAVANGRIIPNTDVVDVLAAVDPYISFCHALLQECLSLVPQRRPSALQMLALTNEVLTQAGIVVVDGSDQMENRRGSS